MYSFLFLDNIIAHNLHIYDTLSSIQVNFLFKNYNLLLIMVYLLHIDYGVSTMISIRNISIVIDGKIILNNIVLDLYEGKVYALMGPNGSGKSSLVQFLAGNPEYQSSSGTFMVGQEDFLSFAPEERACKGLFVVFQHSPAIPGLSVFNFLKEAAYARYKEHQDAIVFEQRVLSYMDFLGLHRSFLYRSLNDGFSGGEKKRFELLQMLILQPKWVILDEIDSGLDIDALKLVEQTIQKLKEKNPSLIVLCITHYQRMAHYLQPSEVYILVKGSIVAKGDFSLVESIESGGYHSYGS